MTTSSDERQAYRDLARFPRVRGQIRSIVPWSRCSMCPEDEPMFRAGTFLAYNSEPTCLKHARLLKKQGRMQAEAAAAMRDLKKR